MNALVLEALQRACAHRRGRGWAGDGSGRVASEQDGWAEKRVTLQTLMRESNRLQCGFGIDTPRTSRIQQ